MATITVPQVGPRNLDESHRRVEHPLQRLRIYIRAYVCAEGLAVLALYLALWFWVALVLDYGSFKAFDVDWVQILPRWARALFLGCCFAGAITVVRAGRHTLILIILAAMSALFFGCALVLASVGLPFYLLLGALVVLILAAALGMVVFLVFKTLGLLLRGLFLLVLGTAGFLALNILAWFVIGLLADLELLGTFVPTILLLVVLVVPAVFLIVTKLFTEFGNQTLALLLERRYPRQLGDRLITAVELADVKRAARYGYSPAMIEETIHEAAARVGELPVREVFNWGRLRWHWAFAAFVTIGLYVLVGLACSLSSLLAAEPEDGAAAASFMDRVAATGGDGFSSFHDVAAIWFERNILLSNTIWPRRAHLEVIDFPRKGETGDELRIGRDVAPPTLRVRALKWVIADKETREGWRALRWHDLNTALLNAPLPPAQAVPDDWQARDPDYGMTIDEVELYLDKSDVHQTLSPEAHKALRDLLDELKHQASLSHMSRKLRMLKIPDTVEVIYKGESGTNRMTLQRLEGNEYSRQFTDLKETIRFWARGEDYYTPTRQITVVPPPSLVDLVRDEYQPAYLYYRVPRGATVEDLRGRKQWFGGRPVSLFGGDRSVIDVPAGTDIVLTAKADKPIKSVRFLPPRKGAAPVVAELKLVDDAEHKSFQARFDNVRTMQDFIFEFTDTDEVVGLRRVVIKPVDDAMPDPDVQVQVVRKTGQGYMVTPIALVPFSGKVKDDHGLDVIEYAFTLTPLDSSGGDQTARAHLQLRSVFLTAGGPGYHWLAAPSLASAARETVERSPLAGFAAHLRDRPNEYVPLDEILRRLGENSTETAERLRGGVPLPEALSRLKDQPPERPLLRTFEVDAEDPDAGFDLSKLPRSLKVGDNQIQPRYKMMLWMEAVDNDIETGPHHGQSKEKFVFLVVSETELLSEISKDEEKLHVDLDNVVRRLRENEAKLVKINQDLAAPDVKADQFASMSVGTEKIGQSIDQALGDTTDILTKYLLILKEMKTNRVQQHLITKVEKDICNALDSIRGREFPRAQEGVSAYHRAFDVQEPDLSRKLALIRPAGSDARNRVQELIKRLDNVLNAMERLATINVLITKLREIEAEESKQYELIRRLKGQIEEELLKSIFNPDQLPEKRP